MKKILLALIAFLITINTCCMANITQNNQDSLLFRKLLTGSDEDKAIIYYQMAKSYSENNEHENAIKYYTKAIELNPKLVQAYIDRAKDCGDMGDYKCSLENYEMVKKLYPNNPNVYWATSLYKTNTKDLDGAMEDIDTAISMVKRPEASYYAQKAWVYLEKKDYENAIKWVKKALRRDYKDEYTLGLLTVMTFENARYDDVLRITKDSLKYGKVAKENYVLLMLRARALYYTGQKDEAVKQMEDVIKFVPENEEYKTLKDKMQKGVKID